MHCGCRFRGEVESLQGAMPQDLKSRPITSPTPHGCRRSCPKLVVAFIFRGSQEKCRLVRVCCGHGSTTPPRRCRRRMADYVRLRRFVGRACGEPTPKLIGAAQVIFVVLILNACIEVGPSAPIVAGAASACLELKAAPRAEAPKPPPHHLSPSPTRTLHMQGCRDVAIRAVRAGSR